MCLITPYYNNKIEDEINCIMKIKGPFYENDVVEWSC